MARSRSLPVWVGLLLSSPLLAAASQAATELTWTKPAAWQEEAPTSPMRRAQYRIAGPAGDAECVVFYFGAHQGGDAAANATRWASQFTDAQGKPATAKTGPLPAGARKGLLVEVAGTYQASSMGSASGAPKAGYMLLGAIVEGPDANWFFKMTGPAVTVRAQRAAFEQMIASAK
jgi:hypothetical protein